MKKLLSLIVLSLFMMTGLAWAQGLETFANLGISGTSYQTGVFEGQDGSEWTFVKCRGDVDITGKAIMIGRNQNPISYFQSGTITGGIGQLEFKYMQAFGTNVDLEVYVLQDGLDDQLVASVTSSGEQNVKKQSGIINVEIEGDFQLKFINQISGAGQVCVDDIEWTGYEASDPNLPSLTVNPISLSGFGYEMGSPESQSQQFRVLSVNIDEKIVITAPDNYQLSLNSIFNNPQSVINARINDGSGTFYVRLEPGLPVGPYNGNITIAPETPVDGISTVNVSLSGEVTEVIPEVTLDKTSLSGFSYIENRGPSEDLSFTIKGKGIQDHIAITLDSGNSSPFELRIEDEQNYESDLTLQNVETHTIDTKIYVRLKEGLSTGPYSDTIEFTCSDVSGNISSITLSGLVREPIGPDYFIDFENETKGAYASASVELSGLYWDMTEALIGGNEDNDWKIGEK